MEKCPSCQSEVCPGRMELWFCSWANEAKPNPCVVENCKGELTKWCSYGSSSYGVCQYHVNNFQFCSNNSCQQLS